MRRVRNTNPALLAIVGEGFVSRLSFGMVGFALPLYAHHLGMSLAAIGVLASLNLMVALALKPLMGRLADHIGLKVGLATAIVGRSVVTVLFAVATVPWQLFGARALHGVSIALRDPSVDSLIAEHGGKKAIAQSFAWYQTAKSVGGSLSKVAAGVLITLTASDFSVVFLVAFALSLAPVLVVLRYVREPQRPPRTEPERAPADAPGDRPPTMRFAGAGFLISASGHMLSTFFPLLATEYAGLTAAQAGGLYTIGALAALAGPGFGWLSDNVSRALVLQLRSAANVISSVLYLVSPSLAGFAAGRALDDLGKAAFRPAWGSMMAHISSYDRRRRAQMMGTMSAGEDAGEMLGPILAGLLWATGGVGLLLGGRIALALGAEAYTYRLGRWLATDDATGPPGRREAALRRGLIAVPSTAVAAVGLWSLGPFQRSSDTPDRSAQAESSTAGTRAPPGPADDRRREAGARHTTTTTSRTARPAHKRRNAPAAQSTGPAAVSRPTAAPPTIPPARPSVPGRTRPQTPAKPAPAPAPPEHTPLAPTPAEVAPTQTQVPDDEITRDHERDETRTDRDRDSQDRRRPDPDRNSDDHPGNR